MQPQHSCGTLESGIKIFGCTVRKMSLLYALDILMMSCTFCS